MPLLKGASFFVLVGFIQEPRPPVGRVRGDGFVRCQWSVVRCEDGSATTDNGQRTTDTEMTPALIGRKLGMTRIYDEKGTVVPVTVVQAGPCHVTQVKTAETDGYNAVQLGFE